MLNRKLVPSPALLCAGILVLPLVAAAQTPLSTQCTYQGRLMDGGSPANAKYDFEFRMFDAEVGGNQKGGVNPFNGLQVTDGLFNVVLDFGAEYNNERRWLEIKVKPDIGGVFVTLPRQELRGTPYSLGLRLPVLETLDTAGNAIDVSNNSTGRVLRAVRGGAGGLAAIRADSSGDSAVWGQGDTATAEGVTAISTGGANALDAQSQGTAGRAGNFTITNAGNTAAALVASTSGTGPAALLDGRVEIGSTGSNTGDLQIFLAGSAADQVRARGTANGGYMDLSDEAGSFHAGFEADSSGTGGFAYVYRSASSQGFTVDGNTGGNEPRVTISGSARSAVFDMAESGNDSVALPISAIAASECFDEPGVASNKEGVTSVAITSTALTTISSRTITVPDSGYVLVLATTQLQISHTTGTSDLYNIGISDSSTALPDNQDLLTSVIAAIPSGTYQKAITPHGLFSVAAGSHTFYFLGQKTSASSADADAFDVQFTLAFFSTAYGTVVSTNFNGANGGGGDSATGTEGEISSAPRLGLTPEELEAERMQSIAANQARLERELAEMRVKFDALQKELEANMRAQQAAAGVTQPPVPVPPVVEGDQ